MSALQITDALYRGIVEQAPDAVILTDVEGRIAIWNDGAQALFGYASEEVAGQSIDLIIPENLRKAHWEGFNRAVASGQTKHSGKAMTTRSLSKGGDKLYVDMSFSLIKDAEGRVLGSLAVARDVTQAHQANRALKARLAALEAPSPTAAQNERIAMNDAVTIYHNPACSISRNALEMIRARGIEPQIIEYLKTPPDSARLAELLRGMGLTPRELLRRKEALYSELDLDNPKWTDDALIDTMVRHPILINRPIVVTARGTRLGRPTEDAIRDVLP